MKTFSRKNSTGASASVELRGVLESSRYRAKLELDLIKKLKARTQSSFLSYVRNSTRKIVELLEADSMKLEPIKKLITNYIRT